VGGSPDGVSDSVASYRLVWRGQGTVGSQTRTIVTKRLRLTDRTSAYISASSSALISTVEPRPLASGRTTRFSQPPPGRCESLFVLGDKVSSDRKPTARSNPLRWRFCVHPRRICPCASDTQP